MKKSVTVILGFVFFALNVLAQEFTTEMNTIFTSGNESAHLQHVKAAIDSKNNLHIVFTGYDGHSFYGTNSSGNWKFDTLRYFDTEYEEEINVVYFPNIAIDNNDNIHVVAFDRYSEKMIYGSSSISSGKGIELITVEMSPMPLRFRVYGSMGDDYTDLSIDKNNGLHLICRSDFTTKDEFKYNQCATYFYKPANTSIWEPEVLVYDKEWDDRNWAYGSNSSVACLNDKVFVAIGGHNELLFASKNISGGSWDMETLISTSDDYINSQKDNISLAISPSGEIKFVFYDGSDDDGSPYHGLTIYQKDACGGEDWIAYNDFEYPLRLKCPAVAFDNNGKFYLAHGRNGYGLWHQTCECQGDYVSVFTDDKNTADFVEMLVDDNNTVYVFYTSVYDNKLRLLTVKPQESTTKCNFTPRITAYTGKTNLKPGEKWTATITAQDPECDKIKFEPIIHNEMFTFTDNGNGTATITAIMPEGEGTGSPGLSLWVLDDKHPDIDGNTSVITFELKITASGTEEGSVKVVNRCE